MSDGHSDFVTSPITPFLEAHRPHRGMRPPETEINWSGYQFRPSSQMFSYSLTKLVVKTK